MQTFTPNQIHGFRLAAKKAARAGTNTHLGFLDLTARAHGYSNWHALEKHQVSAPSLLPVFQRTPEEMQELFKKAKKTPGIYRSREEREEVRARIMPIHDKYANAISALSYARDYVKCLVQVKRWSIHDMSIVYSEMRALLPYALERVSEGQYVIVGRDYTPVGMTEDKWVRYADFPNLHVPLSLEAVSRLREDGYLYNDGCPPWNSREDCQAYLRHLEKLIDLVTSKSTP